MNSEPAWQEPEKEVQTSEVILILQKIAVRSDASIQTALDIAVEQIPFTLRSLTISNIETFLDGIKRVIIQMRNKIDGDGDTDTYIEKARKRITEELFEIA
ncbi:hypothetical protein JW758_00930 [Candidatus Peregrinibacteria bacterium]|nr:hypothetical protein [Candidatus Peregrinibacteria bacterium]